MDANDRTGKRGEGGGGRKGEQKSQVWGRGILNNGIVIVELVVCDGWRSKDIITRRSQSPILYSALPPPPHITR